MTEPNELLPCPFCGGEPKSYWQGDSSEAGDDGYWAIECCDIHVHRDTEAEAAAAWNTRLTEQARPAEPVSKLGWDEDGMCDDHGRFGCKACAYRSTTLTEQARPTAGEGSALADEPVAWLHTMHMEGGQTYTRLTEDDGKDEDEPQRTAFGFPGRDYSPEYSVTSEPLFLAALRQPSTERTEGGHYGDQVVQSREGKL